MTKRRILLAGLWALLSVVLLVVAAGAFALYFLHKFNPNPPTNDFPTPANSLAAQQQDIEQFSRLLGMDRSFSPVARAEANRQIATLKSESAALDTGKFRVALMRTTALADNGHTELNDERRRPNYVPVRVTLFADGLHVLRAKSAYADLLGARVESIEARPTREVVSPLERLQGGTEGWRRTRGAIYVHSPEVL